MNITFNTQKLIEKLKNIAPTSEAKQTLAILGNLKMSISNNIATLVSSDLEIEVQSTLECESDGDIEFTLPAKKMLEVCSALHSNDIIILDVMESKADVKAGRSKVSLPILSANDFPLMTYDLSAKTNQINTSELQKIISKTSFAMAYQDSRHFLNGLHICSENNKLVSVCTDGHRLAKYVTGVTYPEGLSLIIPRKAIVEINRILASFSDNKQLLCEFTSSNNVFQLKIEDYIITTKLIEGNYPNFNKVIPDDTKSKIVVDKIIFKNSLNIISKVVNQQYKGVKVTPSADSLHLITSNTESEIGEDEIEANYEGDDISIGFNISYLQDVIDVLDSERVEICFNDQNSGCIIFGDKDERSTFVIMPMRV